MIPVVVLLAHGKVTGERQFFVAAGGSQSTAQVPEGEVRYAIAVEESVVGDVVFVYALARFQ